MRKTPTPGKCGVGANANGGSADEAHRFKHDGDQRANFGVFEVFQEIARTIRLPPGDDG